MKVKPIVVHEQKPVELEGAEGVRMRTLVGPDDGANIFHMRQFEVAPGGQTPHHRHDYEHEVLVLRGTGLVTGEQGEQPCGPGDVVWMPPNEPHQFRNTGSEPLEFICLIPAPKSST